MCFALCSSWLYIVSAPWMRSSDISYSAGFALNSCLFFLVSIDIFLVSWHISAAVELFLWVQVFWEQWDCLDKASPAVCCDTALQQKLLPSSTVLVKISLKWTLLDSFSHSRQAALFILLELELALQGSSQAVTVSLPKSFTHRLWEEAFSFSSYSFLLWKFYKAG